MCKDEQYILFNLFFDKYQHILDKNLFQTNTTEQDEILSEVKKVKAR